MIDGNLCRLRLLGDDDRPLFCASAPQIFSL